jgi:hypothetical protein
VEVSILQSALRLLFLLDNAGADVANHPAIPEAVRVIRSEKRLQALDFWMRNPDYLAAEIMEMVGKRQLDPDHLMIARQLLEDDEPDLRRYPMVRWHFGAYEPIDDAFSKLVTAGLARSRRTGDPLGRRRTDFYLLAAGAAAAEKIVEQHSNLVWYKERAHLVGQVAGIDSGHSLKERQYRVREYAKTRIGSTFGPITDLVVRGLSEMERAS